MSGPEDSSAGVTATGDFKLPISDPGPSESLSPKFRLHLHWETPRLEWRPALASAPAPLSRPELLRLDDPFDAVVEAERYIFRGSLLFDMQRPDFSAIDKAFVDPPTLPSPLLPSFAQMKAWEDEAFYTRLGRTAPLFGAPTPASLLTPPLSAPPPPSPFYKLPDPSAMRIDPAAPKTGGAGDILKAFHGLPIVQQNLKLLSEEGLRQVRALKNEWSQAPWLDRAFVISLSAPLAASVVGGVLGASDARHAAFGLLKGADIPVPWAPGLSFHVDDFGKADPFLLGTKPSDANQAPVLKFGAKLDLLKAIPAIRKYF